MTTILVDEIVEATGGKVLCGKQQAVTGFSIDSRKTGQGELFVALHGARFDGHDFVPDALRNGCGAIVSIPPAEPVGEKMVIQVKNTLAALHDIARRRRLRRDIPVVGVTGTNGKTTTKELIASILSQNHAVLKTSGNFNNHIGLPLCVANMRGNEHFMVLEMGSNARGDIRELCEIVHPDIAVVTNVGEAHLEGFGSVEMVRDTDLEVLGYVKTVCINADDHLLMEGIGSYRGRVITYGMENRADFTAREIMLRDQGSRFLLVTPDRGDVRISLSISGQFNVLNAVAAATVASELGMSLDEIKGGLESFTGVPLRLEIRYLSGALIINDVYNANPASMEGALREFARLRKGRTIAVLGDMLELGAYSAAAHADLVAKLNRLGVDVLIAVGPEMHRAAAGFAGPAYRADTSSEARSLLFGMMKDGDTVLIKGSRGIYMEKVLAGEGCNAL
jgi:UDP-N-acetylmuramoyl-tripeptide--D-alanyl-D-alanine ligase